MAVVYLSKENHEQFKKLAHDNRRSMNKQIEHWMEIEKRVKSNEPKNCHTAR